MRRAIYKCKDLADRGSIQLSIDSQGYPPDLDTLFNGIDVQEHKIRFLRSISIDPMTVRRTGSSCSMQGDPDSDSWGGQNVFDVYSASESTGLDGTKYSKG